VILTLDSCAVLSHGPVSFSWNCELCVDMLRYVVVVVVVVVTLCTTLNVPSCILSLKSIKEII
jgi:hypothetical protein